MSTVAATNLKNASSGSNNVVLNADGTTTIAAPSNILKQATAVASTSGTAIDFTSIPSWTRRITILFNGVSLSATANLLVQLGTSGGVDSASYASSSSYAGSSVDSGAASSTSGFIVRAGAAAVTIGASMQIANVSGNVWVSSHAGARTDGGAISSVSGGGTKSLSGVLDRVRITSTSTDTFDAGSVNILYEG